MLSVVNFTGFNTKIEPMNVNFEPLVDDLHSYLM